MTGDSMTKILKRVRIWLLRRDVARMERRIAAIRAAFVAEPATRFHVTNVEALAVCEGFIADAQANIANLER